MVWFIMVGEWLLAQRAWFNLFFSTQSCERHRSSETIKEILR